MTEKERGFSGALKILGRHQVSSFIVDAFSIDCSCFFGLDYLSWEEETGGEMEGNQVPCIFRIAKASGGG